MGTPAFSSIAQDWPFPWPCLCWVASGPGQAASCSGRRDELRTTWWAWPLGAIALQGGCERGRARSLLPGYQWGSMMWVFTDNTASLSLPPANISAGAALPPQVSRAPRFQHVRRSWEGQGAASRAAGGEWQRGGAAMRLAGVPPGRTPGLARRPAQSTDPAPQGSSSPTVLPLAWVPGTQPSVQHPSKSGRLHSSLRGLPDCHVNHPSHCAGTVCLQAGLHVVMTGCTYFCPSLTRATCHIGLPARRPCHQGSPSLSA